MPVIWTEYAWLPDRVSKGVRITVHDGRITAVEADTARQGNEIRTGLTVPGFANVHSHAFHRALRGRTHGDRGTFWTWRERMYALAARLDPDSYFTLARAVYGEMALAGVTGVGEFHYLHHTPGGKPYADPNAMSAALVAAAAEAGIRITLLDACYLAGGIGAPLTDVQQRFGDGDAESWAGRVAAFKPDGEHVRVGAAIHSVRAVPADQMPVVAAFDGPLHVHLSEQRAENEDCLAVYGRTPTGVLDGAGALGARTTAVHATHLTDGDVGLLAGSGTGACFSPTTERDLGDGIGPARALASAGVALSLGSDSHAVIDLVEEARALELDERLATEARGHFSAAELLDAATAHHAIGWADAGRISPGFRADLVTVGLGSVRTAGIAPDGVLFAASAADVTDVMVDGRVVVADGRHRLLRDVPGHLRDAIGAVTS